MFLLDSDSDSDLAGPALVTSASDLTLASQCEFSFLRTLDLRLGRISTLPESDDPMLERAARLGDEHEERIAADYRARLAGVVTLDRPERSRDGYRAAAAETLDALRSGAPVVCQATFFDETDPALPYLGFADFLELRPDGRYRVLDSKLARSAKVTALMQVAAYHEQLVRLGVPADDSVALLLGDGTVSEHRIDDIRPVLVERRARMHAIAAEHRAESGAVRWGDPRYGIDGRCPVCEPEVISSRDLLLVAGIRTTQRTKLHDVGIRTLDALAATPVRPDGCTVPEATYATLQAQAALQAAAPEAPAGEHPALPFELYRPETIAELPAPDPGDLFFDFEGDPLWRAPGPTRPAMWGLDYLFGMVDDAEVFTAFWAHDLEAERRALVDFLELVRIRRAAHPGMHIYHYAPYERTHLLSIAARHGTGEHEVDDLLRAGVLVDLYAVVKKSVRVGSRSYSIKKLEPLYMGDELRDEDGVTTGADSIVQYRSALTARDAGDVGEWRRILESIGDYNRYDCVSTRRLRNWLVDRAAEVGVLPGTTPETPKRDTPFEPSGLAEALLARATSAASEADAEAWRLASAAIDYHARENKSFWAEHFARLIEPVELWADTRGVLVADRVEIDDDWALTDRGSWRRRLRIHGAWAPGTGAVAGDVFLLYDPPTPFQKADRRPGSRLDQYARVVAPDAAEEGCVLVDETGEEPWDELPMAIAPTGPPQGGRVAGAIADWGRHALDRAPEWPRDGVSQILRGRPPSGELAALGSPDDAVRAVAETLPGLERSYLAVQGPPGTGKTHLAAHVIERLVRERRWAVGVVAQSHAVVLNLLERTAAAGLPASLIGKSLPRGEAPGSYAARGITELRREGYAAFAAEHADSGYVLGGTAWDLTNTGRVARRQLDLLVIDEAGQFSLAATIGVAVSARRLLLLGDPQQLPQVSQGTHPAPVDASALGAISAGHDVLPPELGYFLAESRRMHPALTRPVSRLAYAGELRAHPSTSGRMLDGIEPGLHPVPLGHSGNATDSPEEALEVVRIARRHLGRAWTDPGAGRAASPLEQADLIVVTPYNAQVERIRVALDGAGLTGVRVGTVDKFQGQEAVVSIVSLAASSAADVARGLPFLLSRNRLNVAISRAQWASYLVHSPALAETLPHTAEEVLELSRFLELVGRA